MVVNAAPHYLLISESQNRSVSRNRGGRWRFVLEQIGGNEKLVVADSEPDVAGERLQLLTVIRGLEALDQPSRVTLLTSSKYVSRGIRRGLPHWRENGWRWERFGQMCNVNDVDLWRRLDRALQLHTVDCRNWRLMNSPYEMEPLEPIRDLAYNREPEPEIPRLTTQNAEPNRRHHRPTKNRIASIARQEIDDSTRSARSSAWKSWFQQWNRMLYAIPTLIL